MNSNIPVAFEWTTARVDQLRQLHAEGFSFSEIASQIGGITRNAAIGKAARIGLDARASFNNAPIRKLDPVERARRLALRAERRNAAQRRRWALAKMGTGISLPPEPLPPPAPVPLECRPCSLLELTADTCRFPIGDPGERDFHFCGAQPQVGSYCGFHDKLTHSPASKRERRPFYAVRGAPA